MRTLATTAKRWMVVRNVEKWMPTTGTARQAHETVPVPTRHRRCGKSRPVRLPERLRFQSNTVLMIYGSPKGRWRAEARAAASIPSDARVCPVGG